MSMGIEFRVSEHTMTHKSRVEVFEDGEFIAGIYGHDDGLRVVSKYLDGVDPEPNFPPAIVIKLLSRSERGG